MDLANKCALVVGLKKSGIAAVKLLLDHGAQVLATDLKPLEGLPEARTVLESLRVPFALQTPEVFEAADLIVLSPDVPADLPPLDAARARGVDVIGEVELAAPFLKGRTIGITGSNGKTTTTSLTGHILREAGVPVQVGGNIGAAVCGMVETSREDGWNVLELSSFQLETIREFRAHIGVCLNVTQNHLDRHHTFERYAAAKGRLFETQQTGDFAVLNADDPVCRGYAERTPAVAQWFSSRQNVKSGASLCGDQLILLGKPLMKAGEVPIRGRHNIENVLAASIAAARVGVSHEAIASAVRRIKQEGSSNIILWGSSTLTSLLLEQELVDEMRLIVYPVLLGIGKRFFAQGTPPRTFELLSSKATPSGVVVNVYKYAGSLKPA